MVGLILSICIALGALVFLFLLARRRKTAQVPGSGQTTVDAYSALQRLQTGLLPAAFVARLFDRADLDYVRANATREVQERFAADRKRIAVAWVERVRTEIQELRRFHLGQSRLHPEIALRTELGLAFDFASLLMACRILEWSLRLRGPYASPGIVEHTMGAAEKLCGVSEKSLEAIAAQAAVAAEARSARVAG